MDVWIQENELGLQWQFLTEEGTASFCTENAPNMMGFRSVCKAHPELASATRLECRLSAMSFQMFEWPSVLSENDAVAALRQAMSPRWGDVIFFQRLSAHSGATTLYFAALLRPSRAFWSLAGAKAERLWLPALFAHLQPAELLDENLCYGGKVTVEQKTWWVLSRGEHLLMALPAEDGKSIARLRMVLAAHGYGLMEGTFWISTEGAQPIHIYDDDARRALLVRPHIEKKSVGMAAVLLLAAMAALGLHHHAEHLSQEAAQRPAFNVQSSSQGQAATRWGKLAVLAEKKAQVEHVTLHQWHITDNRLLLSGQAPSKSALSDYCRHLEREKSVRRVVVNRMKNEEGGLDFELLVDGEVS